jgi:hypothetical protein
MLAADQGLHMTIKNTPKDNVSVVMVICATGGFLGSLAAYVILLLYGDEGTLELYIRPLVPTFTAIGAAAVLWLKNHNTQQLNTLQNQELEKQTKQATDETQHIVEELDGKLESRILDVMREEQQRVATQTQLHERRDARITSIVRSENERQTAAKDDQDHEGS